VSPAWLTNGCQCGIRFLFALRTYFFVLTTCRVAFLASLPFSLFPQNRPIGQTNWSHVWHCPATVSRLIPSLTQTTNTSTSTSLSMWVYFISIWVLGAVVALIWLFFGFMMRDDVMKSHTGFNYTTLTLNKSC